MVATGDFEILQPPAKSPSDRKDYRLLKLSNGLKVLLLNHPNVKQTDKDDSTVKDKSSAVSLCIDVGSFEDPYEVQGLFHFLEHMVFMGSQKYPKENDFDQFIKSRNGVDNAMTECEFTIFYFSIDQEHLAGALDRFAQFFIAPLMLPESMQREMEAVESEFQNSVNNDAYRMNQIFASMALDDHPAANFTWGNLTTLKSGIDDQKLHQTVHEFRRKFYRSNRMHLCIQSNLWLDAQQRMVAECFNDIKPEYGSLFRTTSVNPSVDVFKTDFYKKMFFVKSKTMKRKLFMTFLLPSLEKNYKNKSLDYLAFLFNYEGRMSLNSYLKKEALSFHVGAKIGNRNFESNSMFTFFTIEVSLTRDGYDEIATVLDAVFGYLFIIKMTPMEEHKEIYEEFKQIKDTLFNFRKEKSAIENVLELSVNMKYFNDDDVIVGKETLPEFDEKIMKAMIDKVNERKFNLMVLSDNYKKYDKVEQWFGTEYAEVDFPFKFTQLWNERWIRKEFSLPSKNRFICRQFEISCDEDKSDLGYPLMIFKSEACKSFFKADNEFNLPHGYINIHFKSLMTESSTTAMNMTSIFSLCVKSFLSNKLYPATIAGYNYKLNSVEDGLILKLSGFNEKLPLIVDIITKAIGNTEDVINKATFEIFKKELKKNCYNYIINSTLFNEELRLNVIKPNHKFYFDRYKDVDKIAYMNFKEFLLKFLISFEMKILIEGNFTKAQALKITSNVIMNLPQENGMEKKQFKDVQVHSIPLGATYIRVKSLLSNDKNSVIKNYYQIGRSTTESTCLLELLVKVMREPLFNLIRTQEQLGYAVSCSSKNDHDVLGLAITVESQEKRHSSWTVDAKIESFLKSFLIILEDLNEGDFKSMKKSIIAHKRSPDTDLETKVNRNWNEIRENKFQFERNVIEARQLELLKKEDLLVFFKDNLLPETMRKLSTQVVACAGDEDSLLQHGYLHLNLLTDEKFNTVKNIAQLKSSLAALQ